VGVWKMWVGWGECRRYVGVWLVLGKCLWYMENVRGKREVGVLWRKCGSMGGV
jgi:hypothetical protein